MDIFVDQGIPIVAVFCQSYHGILPLVMDVISTNKYWCLGKITPSVMQICNNTETTKYSFFSARPKVNGHITIHLNDEKFVYQWSSTIDTSIYKFLTYE